MGRVGVAWRFPSPLHAQFQDGVRVARRARAGVRPLAGAPLVVKTPAVRARLALLQDLVARASRPRAAVEAREVLAPLPGVPCEGGAPLLEIGVAIGVEAVRVRGSAGWRQANANHSKQREEARRRVEGWKTHNQRGLVLGEVALTSWGRALRYPSVRRRSQRCIVRAHDRRERRGSGIQREKSSLRLDTQSESRQRASDACVRVAGGGGGARELPDVFERRAAQAPRPEAVRAAAVQVRQRPPRRRDEVLPLSAAPRGVLLEDRLNLRARLRDTRGGVSCGSALRSRTDTLAVRSVGRSCFPAVVVVRRRASRLF